MKSDQTALGLDDSFIDNSRIVFIIDSEIQRILAAAEVIHRVISETGRRSDESSYINTGIFTKYDTIRVDQKNMSIGIQVPFDQGLLATGNPVQ